ncbi:MAG: hypothetical protein C5B47_06370 [Verrucomicrobia bacterium]|nr:MAG: hypothetical protein C5B47_06370 [Verrucomicrobiota bacterium]
MGSGAKMVRYSSTMPDQLKQRHPMKHALAHRLLAFGAELVFPKLVNTIGTSTVLPYFGAVAIPQLK